jgi:cholesterol transport system auxiliary component
MTRIPNPLSRALALMVAGLCALSLGGCVTVFPKVKPVQLYHFGIQAEAAKTPAKADAAGVTVLSGPVTFNRAVAGDRILSVTGGQSAYLAGGRWTTPAVLMFEESLNNAFVQGRGDARVIGAKDPVAARLILRLDVRAFEVRYPDNGRGVPTATVNISGLLADTGTRAVAADRVFDCQVKARSNRLAAIVEAMNEAVSDCQTQIVTWTDETAALTLKR